MKPDIEAIEKAGGERLEVSPKNYAFVLPETDGFRKMVAYSGNSRWTWVHCDFRGSNGKNRQKKK